MLNEHGSSVASHEQKSSVGPDAREALVLVYRERSTDESFSDQVFDDVLRRGSSTTHLAYLENEKLIEETDDGSRYQLTDAGVSFVERHI